MIGVGRAADSPGPRAAGVCISIPQIDHQRTGFRHRDSSLAIAAANQATPTVVLRRQRNRSSFLKSYRSGGEYLILVIPQPRQSALVTAFGHFQHGTCVPRPLQRAGAVGTGTLRWEPRRSREMMIGALQRRPSSSVELAVETIIAAGLPPLIKICCTKGDLPPNQRPALLHADPCSAAELDRSKKLTYRVAQIGSASCGGFPFRECVVVPSQNRPLTCQDHGGTEDLAPKTPLGQNHPNIHAVARPET